MATAPVNTQPTMPQGTDDSKLIGTLDHQPTPARWYLRAQAIMWRFLMAIGMWLHRLAPPRPRNYAFTRVIPTTISPSKGSVTLYFYVPKNYLVQRKLGRDDSRFPVVVNFHGGGFTIGHPCDDAKWASAVVEECNAVCVCVDYRLAPEHPFPTAVEDGVDAILFLAKQAKELHLDPDRIAVSGFSCGGNLAFTVPMRLHEELDPRAGKEAAASALPSESDLPKTTLDPGTAPSAPDADASASVPTSPTIVHPTKTNATAAEQEISSPEAATVAPEIANVVKPIAIVPWYPSADYTLSRTTRRETCEREDMELSGVFTALFDSSYIVPRDLNKSNPYLSPGLAPEALLREGLPDNIIMFTCEWDMLRAEAQNLRDRLEALGKRITTTMIKGVPHGWDKSPNPLWEPPGMRDSYLSACKELRRVFRKEPIPRRASTFANRFSFISQRNSVATDAAGASAS